MSQSMWWSYSKPWEVHFKRIVFDINFHHTYNEYGETDSLAYPYLTNIHVDIIPKGLEQWSRQESCLWSSKWVKYLAQGDVRIGGH